MNVAMKIAAILLFVFAIGNCAPQNKDHVSIAPSDSKQKVDYELVSEKLPSDSTSNRQASNDTTVPPSTTKGPETTTIPTTTVPPITTSTSTVAPTTTSLPPTTSSTTLAPTTTTIPTTTSSSTTTTAEPQPLTTTARPEPIPCRRFDGPSFIGGIVLTVGLIAISFVVWKFYKSRTERNYHTL